jgi:hypothetical protein
MWSPGVRSVATVPLRVLELAFGNMTAIGTSAHPIDGELGA